MNPFCSAINNDIAVQTDVSAPEQSTGSANRLLLRQPDTRLYHSAPPPHDANASF